MLIDSTSRPLRASSQETIEFEFHMSPVLYSSRPHTGVGTSGARRSSRRATSLVLSQPSGALDRLAEIGDDSVPPAADLVAEDAEATRPAGTDGAAAGDSSSLRVGIGHRSALDRVPALGHAHLERRVIEVERAPVLEERHDGLEDLAVEAHRVTSGAQGEPIQVDAGLPAFVRQSGHAATLRPEAEGCDSGWPGRSRAGRDHVFAVRFGGSRNTIADKRALLHRSGAPAHHERRT